MKMNNSTKIALFSFVGILVLALSIWFISWPNIKESREIDAECVQLQARLTDLQAKEADREKYEAGIIEYEEKYEEVLSSFPADINQEITIMFMQGIKDNNDFSLASFELGEKEEFYTLGTSGATTLLDSSDSESSDSEDSTGDDSTTEASTEETSTEENSTDASASGDALAEAGSSNDDALTCYRALFPLEYYGSYNSLKDVVEYIDSYSDRMTVNTLSIEYDEEGFYQGEMDVMCYSVEGSSRPERNIDLSQVDIGVDNIFGGGSSSSSDAGSTLNKYNDNDGAAIETSYDFYTMVSASTSDVSAKVVGQNGTGKESSVISNSDNSISTIKYEIYEKDGKNYCKYTLDDQQSYEAEITSAEDVKILIQSSERKNDDDQVKVKITVNNDSSLPVYIKVSGDDTVSPRVSITKTGLVKVYQ